MSAKPVNIIPVPACWRSAWQRHANIYKLLEFPTRAVLEAEPVLAVRFCNWVWQQLKAHENEFCGKVDPTGCRQCQLHGVSEVIAIRVLGLLVRNVDPILFLDLEGRFQRMVAGYAVRRPGNRPTPDPAPNGSPGPMPPRAVAMALPRRWVVTNAVAREVRKYSYWLDEP